MAIVNGIAQIGESLRAERVPLDKIPVIDFSPFLKGHLARRSEVALQIGHACRDIGFFYLVDHGVPHDLVAHAFAEAKRFFDLPMQVKQEIAIERSPYHRGYFGYGGENLNPAKQPEGDFKEGIKIGRDLPMDHQLVRANTPLHGPNQWPDNLPGWKETWEEYYEAMCGLGVQIMRAFALALDLDETFFDNNLTLPMATAGPLHYPPQTGQITEKRLGAGAHTDFGCLTMLAQQNVPGLQVRNSAKVWIDAPCIKDSFVVNIGDMMARWTNDLFASTLHRGINVSGQERYSIPFFFDPDFDADVSCLETCQDADNPPRYPPTTGLQHLLDMINATFDYRQETV
ncbi:MAG: hypothetical protein OEU36_17275 [Gammaproteobacteria bacterium]|nr:hypothetical protein [Gammaproteobacteria bacterium]